MSRAPHNIEAAWAEAANAAPDGYDIRLTSAPEGWRAAVGSHRPGGFDVWMAEWHREAARALRRLARRLREAS